MQAVARAISEAFGGPLGMFDRQARAAIAAYKTSLAADGYVIVPREPTEAMKSAGVIFGPGDSPDPAQPADIYRAMIDAGEVK